MNKQSVDVIEINEALYSSLQLSWSPDLHNRNEKWQYNGEGLFDSKSNLNFTRLLGVYVKNAKATNLATTAEHVFNNNLFAKHPMDFSLNKLIKELLHISDNFPLKK